MNEELVISAGVLAMITLEVIKRIVRKWVLKKPDYDFPPVFYNLTIPFLTALWSVGLGYIGWAEPVTYTLQTLFQWLMSIIVMLVAYNFGLAPLKEYSKEYKFKHL